MSEDSLHDDEAIQAKFAQAFALHRGGQLAEADALYGHLLERAPDHFDALHFRGVLLHQTGRHAEALELIQRAIALDPAQPAPHANLGLVLQALGRQDEAIESYDRARALNPESVENCMNRGHALRGQNRYEEALASFDQALAQDAQNFDALSMKGLVLFEMRTLDAAVAALDQALALRPDEVAALSNRGGALIDLKRPAEALASIEHALRVAGDSPIALFNRGIALRDLKRPAEAAQSFARLLEIDADFQWAQGYLLNSKQQCCDWTGYAEAARKVEAAVSEGRRADIPYSFLTVSNSAAAQLKCAQTWTAEMCPAARDPVWTGARYRHDRIRLAYLSSDFSEHAVSYLIAELFEIHDRSRFEVSGLSFGPDIRSPMRERLERGFDRFIDVRAKGDREVARMLADMEVDIAIDLNGFTQSNRALVFAQRGAPVQANYLGYPGTMGADYIDYIIADPHLVPAGHEKFYAEKVVRLPDAYQVNDRKRAIAARAPSRAEAGLPPRGFVFCCFNNNFKIVPPTFDIWMRLLTRKEASVLWLLEDNAVVVRNLRAEAQSRGIAANRIIFAPRVPVADHLARHNLADLFLDTLPYNAHTTASDALWAGLPLITCMGSTFAGRVAGSLLNASGMPDLITHTLADYEALALRLAADPALLESLRQRMVRNRPTCALFDTERYRQHIESAYLCMHERSQQGLPPEGFSVES